MYYDEAIILCPRAIRVAVVLPSDAHRQFLASPGTPASVLRVQLERSAMTGASMESVLEVLTQMNVGLIAVQFVQTKISIATSTYATRP